MVESISEEVNKGEEVFSRAGKFNLSIFHYLPHQWIKIIYNEFNAMVGVYNYQLPLEPSVFPLENEAKVW